MHTDFGARRGLRALVLTTILALALISAGANAAQAAAPVDTGQMGASWMATQILANHGFLESFGAPDPVDTAYAVIGLHEQGFDRYVAGDWDAALRCFEQVLAARPEDRPASLLAERCRRFRLAPPPDWEGIADHA